MDSWSALELFKVSIVVADVKPILLQFVNDKNFELAFTFTFNNQMCVLDKNKVLVILCVSSGIQTGEFVA